MKQRRPNRWIDRFNRLEEYVLVGMFVLMVAVIFLQVIMRKVFNNSLYWSEELGKFLFVWISWLGISLGARKGEHIRITMLLDKLPFRTAQAVNILSELIVIGICAVTLYYGAGLVMSQSGTRYAGIKISVSWGYVSVVLGCGLMVLRSVAGIARSAREMVRGAPEEPAGGEGGEVDGQ